MELIGRIVSDAAQALHHAGWRVDVSDAMPADRASDGGPDTEDEFLKVAACDILVLIFPMLWCAAPATIKKWIETVFGNPVCGDTPPEQEHVRMHGKKAMVVAVAEETERVQRYDSLESSLTDMLRPLLEGTLNYLGFEVLRPFFIHGITRAHAAELADVSRKVMAVFSQLEQRANLYGRHRPRPGPGYQVML